MKKIKICGLMAGPKGVYPAGSVIELSDKEADFLVRSNQAVYVEKAAKVEVKTASAPPVVETADSAPPVVEVPPVVETESAPPADLDPNN